MTNDDILKIIDWITDDGQVKGLLEAGNLSEDVDAEQVYDFLTKCYLILSSKGL